MEREESGVVPVPDEGLKKLRRANPFVKITDLKELPYVAALHNLSLKYLAQPLKIFSLCLDLFPFELITKETAQDNHDSSHTVESMHQMHQIRMPVKELTI